MSPNILHAFLLPSLLLPMALSATEVFVVEVAGVGATKGPSNNITTQATESEGTGNGVREVGDLGVGVEGGDHALGDPSIGKDYLARDSNGLWYQSPLSRGEDCCCRKVAGACRGRRSRRCCVEVSASKTSEPK